MKNRSYSPQMSFRLALGLGLLALALIIALGITGCLSTGGSSHSAQAASAGKKEATAQDKADAAQKERLGMAAANVQAIAQANAQTPASPQKAVIETEAALAQQNIGEPPDAKELAAAAERERLQAEGKAEAAQKLASESRARGEALSADHARAIQERDAARAELTHAQAQAKAEADRLEREHRAAIAALQAKIEEQDIAFLTKIIGGIGGLCLLGAVAVVVLSIQSPLGWQPKNALVAGAFVLSAGGCFGMVRFLSHPWVPHVIGALVLAAVGWSCWRMLQHAKEGKVLALQAADSANTYGDLSKALVAAIEKFKGAVPEVREQLKGTLFDQLTTDHDSLIRRIKAELGNKS